MDIAVKKLQDEIERLREEVDQFTHKHDSTIAFQQRFRELCEEVVSCSKCPRCIERKLVEELNLLLKEMQTRLGVLKGRGDQKR